MKNPVLKWELIGIAVISLLGSAFHFIFEWAGELAPIGFFTPVNESVFEHLKLTFWPTILYSLFSYKWRKSTTTNFILAKAVGLYTMPIAIIVIFYGYTTFTGESIVIIDILIFFIAVVCGQLASYRILKMKPLPPWLSWVSLSFIVILALIYGLFTFFPPHVPFFMDENTGIYGIPK
ncbi:MAG: hypothetical protein A2Y58_04930 [Chloroflexi bacterium RBG_13_51_52]|nr:MAG: hypothetical protein A2Y58_04930 [Chloroflexi bacterium RBG_13_51_52]